MTAKVTPRGGLESGFNFSAFSGIVWGFIHAGVEQASDALRAAIEAKRWVKNICGKTIASEGDYFSPYKIVGNEWTNVVDFLMVGNKHLSQNLLKSLSKSLSTRTIFAVYERISGVFIYELYDKGKVVESLHWGGAEKSRVVQSHGMSYDGFTFFSKLRKVRASELSGQTVVKFFDSFLKSQGAFLVLETGTSSEGKFTFDPERLEPSEIERADYIGILSESEAKAKKDLQKHEAVLARTIKACLDAYFYAFKARDEYKDWKSRRPTLADCAYWEKRHRKLVSKVKRLLSLSGNFDSDGQWLRAAAINGHEPLVNLLLESGYYSSLPDVLQEAAGHADDHEHKVIAAKISSAIAVGLNQKPHN